jgi:hypothetical protein
MKIVRISLIALSLTTSVLAQGAAQVSAPPNMEILNKNWRREVINTKLNTDPFKVNDQSREVLMAQRQPTELTPKKPDVQRAVQPKPPSSKAPTSGFGRRFETYFYHAKVKNTGEKTIRAIVWGYAFLNPDTRTEIVRFQCDSKIKIGPGKSGDLIMNTSTPPSNLVDAGKTAKGQAQFLEQIIISRIEYSDGSVWQHP